MEKTCMQQFTSSLDYFIAHILMVNAHFVQCYTDLISDGISQTLYLQIQLFKSL